ncbi:xylose isomerase-like protein [Chiua virens]|nr:xylose isomerase-like protein [Chiua virens]
MVQTRRATQLATKDVKDVESQPKGVHTKPPRKRRRNGRQPDDQTSSSTVAVEPDESEQTDADVSPTKRPRKAGRKKDHRIPKPSDFHSRVSSAWKVGAHVSAAGGVENAVVNAARVRANAFALFVKSQRKWSSPQLTDESVTSFKARMIEFGYDPKHVLPHGSYLINLANPDKAKREKSYECFLDDLQRCERLGLMYYNFHPGSTVGNATKEESISHIAQCLNRAHKETSFVVTVIENMCGHGNVIGSQFTDLRGVIEQVEDKSRVGGYDISTKAGWDTTMAIFDDQVGLSYLRGMHLNDSKTPLGSKKDRHENIGLGTLGLSAFLTILSDPRVQNIPLILETPTFEAVEVWEREIQVLNTLSEVGAASVVNAKDEGGTVGERLNRLVGDIQNVVREYCGPKENIGKKAALGKSTPKSKSKSRKREVTDEETTDSDDT